MSKYRIRAVSQMTGLSPALIRAWEARYGLVEPARSAAGYRLYSDEDVALLLGAQRLVQQGIAPMQVARLPRQQLREQREIEPARKPPEGGDVPTLQSYGLLIEQVLAAFSDFDAPRAEALLGRSLLLLPATAACEKFLVPLLREIGERWHRGEMTIAAEHFGTSLVRTKLQSLLETFRSRRSSRRVICACPSGEFHEAGLLMFALEAATQGWEPLYLGANLPLPELAKAVHEVQPDLVALSLTIRPETSVFKLLVTQANSLISEVCPVLLGGPGISGAEELVLSAGCRLVPRSGLLEDLLGAGPAAVQLRVASQRGS